MFFDYSINLQQKLNKGFQKSNNFSSLYEFCVSLNESEISKIVLKNIKFEEFCRLSFAYEVNRTFYFEFKLLKSPNDSYKELYRDIHRKNYENISYTMWKDVLTNRYLLIP